MSDRESQQASIDASEASIPAENGSREVENDPPPLGRAEESVSAAAVAARTRYQRRLQNVPWVKASACGENFPAGAGDHLRPKTKEGTSFLQKEREFGAFSVS